MPDVFIPYGRQDIDDADIAAVVDVLKSDWLTQGPAVPRFERAMADYCGVPYAVAVSNATAALHLACLALGLGTGGRLWTSPITFVASANCARYCGAAVDFVDIDPVTFNLSIAALREKLEQAERNGTLPDIVVPVHFGGQPCEMDEIAALAARYGFAVIEDASHAVGASYRSERIGGGRYSDVTIFSFHPVKLLTTGEGGMALTRRADLAEKIERLRTHGITRQSDRLEQQGQGGWYYEQQELGYNYRLTDIQAALGSSQLRRLDQFLARRRAIARRYEQLLEGLPVRRQEQHSDSNSAWHLYPVQISIAPGVASRRRVFDRMRAAGIGVNVHYIPVYAQPYYRQLGFAPGYCPSAEAYYAGAISLPLFAAMTDVQQDRVVNVLRDALTVS